MIGTIASGNLAASAVAGAGAAGTAAAIAGLATKAKVDGIVDARCRKTCAK
jgi:hypothetical protein